MITIIRNFFLALILLSAALPAYANYSKFEPSKFSQDEEIIIEKWNSQEGITRLEQSRYKKDFYKLANFFQPQMNPLYCGMASSVIILNALRSEEVIKIKQEELEIEKPEVFGGGRIPFNSYSQVTFLNNETDKVKKRQIIKMQNKDDDKSKIDPGVTLKQLSDILGTSYDLNTRINYAHKVNDKEFNNFRKLLKQVLNDDKKYILANFHGKSLGLKTGGHISPLVAYDTLTDSILVLDVAGHKNPWYWVKLTHFYKAMNIKDGDKYRGYLIVWN